MSIMLNTTPNAAWQHLNKDAEQTINETIEKEYQSLYRNLKNGTDLSRRNLTSYSNFPEIALKLGPQLAMSSPSLRKLTVSNTMTAYYLLVNDYSAMAGKLEATILRDGQYTLELLKYAAQNRVKLNHTLEYYEEFLMDDPYFAEFYSRCNPDRDLIEKYLQRIKASKLEKVSDAYLQLILSKSNKVGLEPSMLKKCQDLVHKHPRYALLAATNLITLGIEIDARKIVGLSPRYACAFLQYGVCNNSDYLHEKLAEAPLWAAHYIITSPKEVKDDELRKILTLMKTKCPGHPVLDLACVAINNFRQK